VLGAGELFGEVGEHSGNLCGTSAREWPQCGFINADPTTYFPMCIFTVIARVSVRIQSSVFERLDDRLFLNRNSCFSQAIDGFPSQTAGKTDRFHISSPKICSFVPPLIAHVKPFMPGRFLNLKDVFGLQSHPSS
jgi:hypothetical protein